VGRTPVVPLLAGQTVLAGHLAPDGVAGVAALLPAGSRAVAVPSGGASPPVRRGDTVDVLATFDPQVTGAGDPTLTVAVDALVVDVGPDSATVAVTPEQAKAVAFAVSHGTITVAITPGAITPRISGQRNEVASTPSTAAPASRR
jgi:Flp pilus assembly protein CpaB